MDGLGNYSVLVPFNAGDAVLVYIDGLSHHV
jgi:hypothetical protein